MRQNWHKKMSALLVLALILSMIPVYSAAAADGPAPTLTSVNLSYVSKLDPTKSYDSAVGKYLVDPVTSKLTGNIYDMNGKKYLRVAVQNTVSLVLTVNGQPGELVENLYSEADSSVITHFIRDYEIASAVDPIEGNVTYSAQLPNGSVHNGSYDFYFVVDQDATAESRAALAAKITEAEAVETKGVALTAAIVSAKAANNLLSREAALQAQIAALVAAIDANGSTVNLSYVSKLDPTKSYDSAVGKYLVDPVTSKLTGYIYDKNGKKYLRVAVQNTVSLVLTVNGQPGELVENLYSEADSSVITHFVRDYEIASAVDPIEGNVTYSAQLPNGSVHNGSYDFYFVVNQDATAESRAALAAKITEAEAVETKGVALTAAIVSAKAANNLLSREAALQAQIAALVAAINANDTKVNLSYVSKLDPTKSYDSAVGKYLVDPVTSKLTGNIFDKNGKKYLRVAVQNTVSLVLTVNGQPGELVENLYSEADSSVITHFVRDYEIASAVDPIEGNVTYSAQLPNGSVHNGSYDFYFVVNQDATAESRAALAAKITEAEAVETKGEALTAAIAAAKAASNLLSREAVLQAQITALQAAITANGSTGGNEGGGGPTGPIINEQAGLEVGKYHLGVTIKKGGTSTNSIMNDYVAGQPRLEVTANKLYVYLLMGNASMIKSFSVNGSSASVVESYSSHDIKRYRFEVASITSSASGQVHVVVNIPDVISHDEHYDVTLTFGSPSKVSEWSRDSVLDAPPVPTPGTSTGGEEEEETEQGAEQPGSAPVFKDTASHWARSAIDRAVSLGIATGYGDGTFKPQAPITRVEFTALLARAMKLEDSNEEIAFADSDSIKPWAKAIIQQAVAAGIISGYEDQTFRPAANVSRTDMTVMIVRALGLELVSENELAFDDADSIPAYARAYVATAVKHGLINGVGGNQFGGGKQATRAEAITLVLRAFDYAAAQAEQAEEAEEAEEADQK